MIPATAQPYTNPLGITYDSGQYEDTQDTVLALADWDGCPVRRAEARERGKLRGIGIANYVEITSGAPRERTEITVLPEGRAELVMGTMSSGQGHETSFAQLVTEWLGVPLESIVYVAHDTARVSAGVGSLEAIVADRNRSKNMWSRFASADRDRQLRVARSQPRVRRLGALPAGPGLEGFCARDDR